MKKTLVFLLIISCLFYLRYSIISLVSAQVDGVKYFSFFVTGGDTNGYSYFIFDSPFTQIVGDKNIVWKKCRKLNHNIKNYLESTMKWEAKGDYLIVSENSLNAYKAYIKTKDKLVYIYGYSDVGGGAPSKEEKMICAP